MRRLAALVGASAVLTFAAAAHAGASGTTDVACGSTTAAWNVPDGSVVFDRGPGPVRDTLDALGEYRTHSMLSMGPAGGSGSAPGWVTHSTMYTPGRPGWPTYCSTPLKSNELQAGFPGWSQTSQGGIYTFLYKNGSMEWIGWQHGVPNGVNKGSAVTNWAWNSAPYTWVTSTQDSTQGLYRLIGSDGYAAAYSLFQYRTIEGIATGGTATNHGMVCSTSISYAMNKSGQGTESALTYSHSQINAAANGLYNGVYNECNAGYGFWSAVGSTFTCLDSSLCDEAADQVADCMSTNSCNTSDHSIWTGYANDPSTTATSISPDCVGGWNACPWQAGSPGASVWAYDSNQTVQWNSTGSVYGCFF